MGTRRMDTPSACISFTFAVQKIIGISVDDENTTNYHVQWAPSWINSCNLKGCEKLIKDFIEGQKNPSVDIKEEPSDDEYEVDESNLNVELDLINESMETSTPFDQE